ncbi:MAG TPA: sugar ABC transporter permease [Candidatus Brocadiia bacterium]|nr:sugar ABC transporter permease [Candidatus Brocadiia bacterium]
MFVAPALALYALFVMVPLCQSFWFSLFDWNGYSQDMKFTGMRNYAALLRDGVFWGSLWRNIFLLAASLVVQLPIAIILAALLAGPVRFARVLRAGLFAPMILPTVIVALLWIFIYDPVDGLLNGLLGGIGLQSLRRGWLGEATTALPAVTVAVCWRYTGFHMILFAAGIVNIPAETYEAAELDGASAFARFIHVTLPGLYPVIRVSALLSVVGSMKYFDLNYLMPSGGAPDRATELVATYMYREGINADRWGYGCAIAVALCALTLATGGIKLWLDRRRSQPAGV